jgi:flagellar hook-associated protein 3 FlgL
MLNRITPEMTRRSLISTINDLTTRINTSQNQVSTGKRITQPSDDPLGTQRSIDLRGSLEGTQQYTRTVEDSSGWLQMSDDALGQITDVVHRVQELTVQGGSDTTSQTARDSIAAEIDQLIQAVKQNANTSYQGAYVFAGTKTTTPPYQQGPVDAYQGDAGTVARSIGPGISVGINQLGSDFLGSGTTPGDGKLLNTLRDISSHLRSTLASDHDLLRTSDLSTLDRNLDQLNQSRSATGAVMNRLDAAQSRLADVEVTTTKVLSTNEDADMATSILNYTQQSNALQAALKTGASLIQPSLLDFLR